jgi:hypothetical protein
LLAKCEVVHSVAMVGLLYNREKGVFLSPGQSCETNRRFSALFLLEGSGLRTTK